VNQKKITLDLSNLSIDQTKDFNACLIEHRKDFDQMLYKLSREKDLHPDVFFTSIFSREPEFSPLYERCCQLSFIKKHVGLGTVQTIIIDDLDIYEVLRESNIIKSSGVRILCNENSLRHFLKIFLPIRNLFRSFLFSIFMLLASRKIKIDELIEKELILFSTNILRGSIENNQNSSYSDRNFPNIEDYIPSEARERLVFLPQFPGGPRPYNKIFQKLRDNQKSFLIKADYFKLTDYLYALSYPFRINFKSVSTVEYLDFDIKPLIAREFWQTTFDFKIIESLMNCKIFMRLKERGIKVSVFIDWYENQLSSKGLIYGFKQNYPKSKNIGYCGIIDSASYRINLHPSEYENDQSLIPDKILVLGEDIKNDFMEFTKSLNIATTPSLRYKYLHDIDRLSKEGSCFNILVALPIFKDQSENILSIVAESLESFQEMGGIRVNIKVHPTKTPDAYKSLLGIESENYGFIDDDFFECIRATDLLITSASTTCMEALAIGVPVAIIGAKNQILQNPIPKSINDEYWSICYSSTELIGFTKIIQKIEKNDLKTGLGSIKDSYFKIPTEQNIKELINITNVLRGSEEENNA